MPTLYDFTQTHLAVFLVDDLTRTPLAGLPVFAELELAAPETGTLRIPLAQLATDHVGYVSFDLAGLLERVGGAVPTPTWSSMALDAFQLAHLWIHPAGSRRAYDAFDPELARITADSLVVRLEIEAPEHSHDHGARRLPSLQRPSLSDWRLSPGSFAVSPAALIGEDHCEHLFPASLAIQEFRFRQVVRISDNRFGIPEGLADRVRPGVVQEYRAEWLHLGHSLGQIQYTTPLAPGESVKLAIIDWSRKAQTTRYEDTSLKEGLLHNVYRDRTITETVSAALDEWQRGGSVMGGAAAAGGGNVGLFNVGGAASMGGAYTTSSGSRDLAADNVQKISDRIVQASTALRELQSTVVVQTAQQERDAIETRVITNYNHSHAMTVLYYEVLRHFKVATTAAVPQAAILVRGQREPFTPEVMRRHRRVLRGALLDDKLAGAVDLLDKLDEAAATVVVKPPVAPDQDVDFHQFTLHLDVDACVTNKGDSQRLCVWPYLILTDGTYVPLGLAADQHDTGEDDGDDAREGNPWYLHKQWGDDPDNVNPLWQGKDNIFILEPGLADEKAPYGARFPQHATPPGAPIRVKWSQVARLGLRLHLFGGDEDDRQVRAQVHLKAGELHGRTTANTTVTIHAGPIETWLFACDEERARRPVDWCEIPLRRPVLNMLMLDAVATLGDAERIAIERLRAHVEQHALHYWRAIWLAEDANDRAVRLDAIAWGNGETLLDQIHNVPLEVLGEWVAFPSVRPNLDLPAPDPGLVHERLVTLPTRGIFAEAKLGHCNSSEVIDDTRFWDWQRSPLPEKAPNIADVKPSPHPADPTAQPTPFPSSIVNIVQPWGLPEPHGMEKALAVLGTANLFKDMSASDKVGELLKTLATVAGDQAKAVPSAARTVANLNSLAEAAERKHQIDKGELSDQVQENLALGRKLAQAEAGIKPEAGAASGGGGASSGGGAGTAADPARPVRTPSKGVAITILFKDVNGVVPSGSARAVIHSGGEAIPFLGAPINGGGTVLVVDHALEDGTIEVAADYKKEGEKPVRLTLEGKGPLKKPKGNLVAFMARPVVENKKVRAKTSEEAAKQVSELHGAVLSVKESGPADADGVKEFTVSHLTGKLDLDQA
jgi:hypothetical protein